MKSKGLEASFFRKTVGIVTCALLLTFTQCSPKPGEAAETALVHPTGPCLPLVAFYPSWRNAAYPVGDIDWQTVNGVATGFILPRTDGSLDTTAVTPYLADLVANAHASNNLVYVSIGGANGYGDAFQQISRNPNRRARFVAEVRPLQRRMELTAST